MKVGFLGLSHLGQVYSAVTAHQGVSVVQFDADAEIVSELKSHGPSVVEPGLDDLWLASFANRTLTADPEELRGCDLLFVVSDVITDEFGVSDLTKVRQLMDVALATSSSDCPVIVRSQVPPGFSRQYASDSRQVLYQVETLVFSEAVSRAMNPDRHIIGTHERNAALPGVYLEWLKMFAAPIHVMTYESAELAKISINLLLAASVSTANSLAELCEKIGADWTEIVPALQADPRIGRFAYLKPGLGISGGNLERDLASFCSLALRYSVSDVVISSFIAHSEFRKSFVSQQLAELGGLGGQQVGMIGLSYKPGTASLKNSPSLDVLRSFPNQRFLVHDPAARVTGFPHVRQVEDVTEILASCKTLLIMTPWPQYINELNSDDGWMRTISLIIDPYSVISRETLRNFDGIYRVLGSSGA